MVRFSLQAERSSLILRFDKRGRTMTGMKRRQQYRLLHCSEAIDSNNVRSLVISAIIQHDNKRCRSVDNCVHVRVCAAETTNRRLNHGAAAGCLAAADSAATAAAAAATTVNDAATALIAP